MRVALGSGVAIQGVGLVLLVAWGWSVWGRAGALFVGAVVLLFLGFVVAQTPPVVPPVAVPERDPEELWTF